MQYNVYLMSQFPLLNLQFRILSTLLYDLSLQQWESNYESKNESNCESNYESRPWQSILILTVILNKNNYLVGLISCKGVDAIYWKYIIDRIIG